MTRFLIFLIGFYFLSCDKDLDKVFVDKRIESLFFEYVEEAKESDYRDGDRIYISVYEVLSDTAYCLSFDNSEFYNSEDNFAKFNYEGFKVYVNENVPKSLVKLDNYSNSAKFEPPVDYLFPVKEFLEANICVFKDSLTVWRVNYENEAYLNVRKTIK